MPERDGNQKEWEKFGLTLWSARNAMQREKLLGRRQRPNFKRIIALMQRAQQRKEKRHGRQ